MPATSKVREIEFRPEFIRDISQQMLIEAYNAKPEIVARKLAVNPRHLVGIRDVAIIYDGIVRKVLRAEKAIGSGHLGDDYVSRASYLVYAESLAEDTERFGINWPNDDQLWRRSQCLVPLVARAIRAAERVRQGSKLAIQLPQGEDDDDDL